MSRVDSVPSWQPSACEMNVAVFFALILGCVGAARHPWHYESPKEHDASLPAKDHQHGRRLLNITINSIPGVTAEMQEYVLPTMDSSSPCLLQGHVLSEYNKPWSGPMRVLVPQGSYARTSFGQSLESAQGALVLLNMTDEAKRMLLTDQYLTDDLNITTDGSDGISSVLFYANEEAEVGDEAYFIAGLMERDSDDDVDDLISFLDDEDDGSDDADGSDVDRLCIVELQFEIVEAIPEGESPFQNLYPPGENPFEDWVFPSNATSLPPVPAWVWDEFEVGSSGPSSQEPTVSEQINDYEAGEASG